MSVTIWMKGAEGDGDVISKENEHARLSPIQADDQKWIEHNNLCCHRCQAVNDATARFCDQCRQAFLGIREDPGCLALSCNTVENHSLSRLRAGDFSLRMMTG